jgi:hypothetical protein
MGLFSCHGITGQRTPERIMDSDDAPKMIVGVPGRWASREDIVSAIATQGGGYLFAGMIMMHGESEETFTLEVHEQNDDLAEAFAIASGRNLSEDEIEAIAAHTYCLYLNIDGGSTESAEKMMRAANALLDCGGLGVKVESAGLAHSPETWRELCSDPNIGDLMKAFVTYVGNEDGFYSCGMHNLGGPDCAVEAEIEPDDAAELMHTFLGYLLVDAPELNDDETFSIAEDAPWYRLTHGPCARFDSGDPIHNPYGVWRLASADLAGLTDT